MGHSPARDNYPVEKISVIKNIEGGIMARDPLFLSLTNSKLNKCFNFIKRLEHTYRLTNQYRAICG
jgi:hypothetical protein